MEEEEEVLNEYEKEAEAAFARLQQQPKPSEESDDEFQIEDNTENIKAFTKEKSQCKEVGISPEAEASSKTLCEENSITNKAASEALEDNKSENVCLEDINIDDPSCNKEETIDNLENEISEHIMGPAATIEIDKSVSTHSEKTESDTKDLTEISEKTSVDDTNVTTQIDTTDVLSTENYVITKNDVTSKYAVTNDVIEGNGGESSEEDEWGNLVLPQKGATSSSSRNVTVGECVEQLKTATVSLYKIEPEIRRSPLVTLWRFIVGPPKLNKVLKTQRDLIFVYAAMKFENESPLHNSMLQTLYRVLTRSNRNCPRYGEHWEKIGFQGNDPSTDFRGCGILGLLMTLGFVTTTNKLAASVYELSTDEVQNFPFCVVSINVTRICLQVLREGKLNRLCLEKHKGDERNENAVFEVFQEVYTSVYHRIYHIWCSQNKTMTESGFVMKEVEDEVKNDPMKTINFYRDRLKQKTPDAGKVDSFVGIGDLYP